MATREQSFTSLAYHGVLSFDPTRIDTAELNSVLAIIEESDPPFRHGTAIVEGDYRPILDVPGCPTIIGSVAIRHYMETRFSE